MQTVHLGSEDFGNYPFWENTWKWKCEAGVGAMKDFRGIYHKCQVSHLGLFPGRFIIKSPIFLATTGLPTRNILTFYYVLNLSFIGIRTEFQCIVFTLYRLWYLVGDRMELLRRMRCIGQTYALQCGWHDHSPSAASCYLVILTSTGYFC